MGNYETVTRVVRVALVLGERGGRGGQRRKGSMEGAGEPPAAPSSVLRV